MCAEYLPGPPDLPIDQGEWDEWLKAGIVSQPVTFNEVRVSRRGVTRRPWVYYYESPHSFTIYKDNSPLPKEDEEKDMIIQPMVLYKLDFVKLLEHVASEWGLKPDVGPTKSQLYRVGWREGTALVTVYEFHEYDGMYNDETLAIIREDLGAGVLYVINIGETHDLLSDKESSPRRYHQPRFQ